MSAVTMEAAGMQQGTGKGSWRGIPAILGHPGHIWCLWKRSIVIASILQTHALPQRGFSNTHSYLSGSASPPDECGQHRAAQQWLNVGTDGS